MSDRSEYEHSCPNHGPAYDCGVVQALRERIAELESKEREFDWMNSLRHKAEAENQRLRDAAQAVVDSATPHYDRWVNGVTRICINRLAALLGGGE